MLFLLEYHTAHPCFHRMQAQFDHLAETYFDGFKHDIGERELSYALSFDHDLDVFAASIGLTKTSIASIVQDTGERLFLTVVCKL